jgi:hypothetical protein
MDGHQLLQVFLKTKHVELLFQVEHICDKMFRKCITHMTATKKSKIKGLCCMLIVTIYMLYTDT